MCGTDDYLDGDCWYLTSVYCIEILLWRVADT